MAALVSRTARFVISGLVLAAHLPTPANATEAVVFYVDKTSRPVVRLDRVPSTPGIRATLALYALENGAGCEGKTPAGLVECKLTGELGLGANCSPEHLAFVRSWFKYTPNLTTRWDASRASTASPNGLEWLCYGQPETASWQNVWEVIRIRIEGNLVHVNAIQFWGSAFGHGRVRYEHTFRIEDQNIVEVAAKATELSRSSKSMFE